MNKRILVLSASPRKGGNSDTLCDQFIKGAESAGHEIEKIYVSDQKIGFCKACYACKTTHQCIQDDSVGALLDKMVEAEVIVLATPVYYYSMCGQMKTLIDRALPKYYTKQKISDKEFYFIVTAAEGKATMERTMDGLKGFTECLPGALIKGAIYGDGAWQRGDILGHRAMQEACSAGSLA